MKYLKFRLEGQKELELFIDGIKGDVSVFKTEHTDESGTHFLLDVIGEDWVADLTKEIRPNNPLFFFADMEEVYYNSIGGKQ